MTTLAEEAANRKILNAIAFSAALLAVCARERIVITSDEAPPIFKSDAIAEVTAIASEIVNALTAADILSKP